jgi:phospholipase C
MAVVLLDPGAAVAGLFDTDVALTVARHAGSALAAGGHAVTLTREEGAKQKRGAKRADAFLSIDFNRSNDPTQQGSVTWVHLGASAASQDLAAAVHRAALQVTRHRDDGVRSKRLDVLDPASHDAATAACALELSFVTTAAENTRLHDADYLCALGDAIAAGVTAFVDARVAPRTARAVPRTTATPARAARKSASGRQAARITRGGRSILGLDGRPDPIDHVVVLMMENRSFDHMLGSLRSVFPTLDGIDPHAPGFNLDHTDNNRRYEQAPTTTTALERDPKHEVANVRTQLNVGGRCGGFVTDFRSAYQTDVASTQEVMAYYDYGALPVLHALARAFTICDHWFSSVPGPTWTNRLFVHSGTSLGRVEMPDPPFDLNLHLYDQDTLYDRLNEQNIRWQIYYGDVPQSLVLTHQLRPRNAARYRPLPLFFTHARGREADFPAFAFIEPNYFSGQNDQHPPSDVLRGEVLIARVYNALRANEELWARTLLVVLYDEHGGFYDHIYPGAAVPPDDHTEEYTFDQYGLRVPAILVSPWVAAGPYKTELDHTSLLKYLMDKWRLAPLGARSVEARSFADVFLQTMRTDTPARVLEPMIPAVRAALAMPRTPPPLNDLQKALLAMTELLEVRTPQPAAAKVARSVRMMDGPRAKAEAAQDRVERFLQRQRRRVETQDEDDTVGPAPAGAAPTVSRSKSARPRRRTPGKR